MLGAAPQGGIAQLDRLAGTWKSNGTFVDTAYSKAGTATASTTCAWTGDHLFLLCQQSVEMGGKANHDVAIYTYDEATNTYHFYNVGVEQMRTAQLSVDATSMTYGGSFDDGSKHVLTRTLNVWQSPKAYTWRAEYSLDNGATWTQMGSGASTLQ
jgi:hypothetical protein